MRSSRSAPPVAVLLLGIVTSAASANGTPVPPADTGWASVDGTRLYYESAGQGPAIVFVHGGLLDHRMWDDQFRVFARKYRVIRYDRRGFGRSDFPKGPFSQIDDLEALFRALGVDRATVVGLSYGGEIALEFALEHPNRVDKLVLAGSDLRGFPPRPVDGREAIFQAAGRGEVTDAVSLWLKDPIFAAASGDPALQSRVRLMLADNIKGWSSIPPDQTLWPARPPVERLSEIRVPTLVLVGGWDIPRVREIADLIASRIEGSRKMTFPATGHHLNLEQPVEFDEVLRGFLEDP